MINKYLIPVYDLVYDDAFSYGDFNCRLKMQKMVYLLQELGTSLGDYGFRWYKFGPYSQSLLDDMYASSGLPCNSISYSADSSSNIETLHQIMKTKTEYASQTWAECLASILFIKKYIMPSSASDDEILEELVKRKPHLNQSDTNKLALNIIKDKFNM